MKLNLYVLKYLYYGGIIMNLNNKTKKINLPKEEFSGILNGMIRSAKLIEKKEPENYNGLDKTLKNFVKDSSFESTNIPNKDNPMGALGSIKFVWDSIPHVITVITEKKTRNEILEGKLSRDAAIKRAFGKDSQSFVSSKLIGSAIKMGANPNKEFSGDMFLILSGLSKGTSAVDFAIKSNNYNSLKTILNSKGDVNTLNSGFAPIHKIFDVYDDAENDIKKPNGNILKEYIELNRKLIQTLVIQKTKNINLSSDLGENAMHFLAYSRSLDKDIYKALIERNININQMDYKGNTPLHVAANVGNKDLVNIFKNEPINPNLKNKEGMTPLHIAALSDEADIFEKLIKMGANPNIKDNRGKTPFYYFENDKFMLKYRIVNSKEKEQEKKDKKDAFISKNREKYQNINSYTKDIGKAI
jgi:hypothetical protein